MSGIVLDEGRVVPAATGSLLTDSDIPRAVINMSAQTIKIAAIVALFTASLGCSMPNPLAGAAVPGSTHGGWGAPKAEQAQGPSESRQDESVATSRTEDRAPSRDRVASVTAESEAPVGSATPAQQRLEERVREREARPSEPSPTITTTPVSSASSTSRAAVTRVSFAERGDGRGLVVRMHSSGPIPAYRVEEVSDGRLQLTLFQTEVSSSARRDAARQPVRGYQLSSASDRTIVTFDVEPGVFYERQPYPDRDSDDLLLPLTFSPRPVVAAQASSRSTPVASASTGNGAPDAASREHWKLDCIVIDPGHGGRDPGAVAHGIRESEVNLAIAQRLGRMVQENLGIRVVYTRRDDRFVELAERGRIANQSCGKLFVSIHANSASNASAHGTETFFLGVHRSESARRVMERENAVIALESDPSLYSGMDDAALIMQTMAQSTYQRSSEQLSALIENQFQSTANRQSRGVKQAGFLVLWRASMPAVLIETGFLTNREEARFLGSARGQDVIAQSIFRAIEEYKRQYERGLGVAVN